MKITAAPLSSLTGKSECMWERERERVGSLYGRHNCKSQARQKKKRRKPCSAFVLWFLVDSSHGRICIEATCLSAKPPCSPHKKKGGCCFPTGWRKDLSVPIRFTHNILRVCHFYSPPPPQLDFTNSVSAKLKHWSVHDITLKREAAVEELF